MPDMPEYRLVARHDGSSLTVRREVVSSATRTVMLRIDSPLAGLSAAYLTEEEARALADGLARVAAEPVTTGSCDSHHRSSGGGGRTQAGPEPPPDPRTPCLGSSLSR